MIKIYVGCGLTHAPEEFKNDIVRLKKELTAEGRFEILEFVGMTAGTAQDVYEHDIHNCVANCDIFVGDFTYPSLGLGWEMGVTVEKRKIPALAVAKKGTTVSRLVLGAVSPRNPNYTFQYYEDIMEVVELVKKMTT